MADLPPPATNPGGTNPGGTDPAADLAERVAAILAARLPTLLAPLSPAALGPADAAALAGFSRSTWDAYGLAGLTPAPAKVGGKVLYGRAEIESWVAHGMPPRAEWAATWRAALAAGRPPAK